jgi:mitotic spindle assembly checkpoint protein MAD1
MNNKTQPNTEGSSSSRHVPSSLRSSVLTRSSVTGSKRDSLAAELEKGILHYCSFHYIIYYVYTMSDPQLSTAKRQQRTQALSSSLAQSSLERQLLSTKTAKMELESKLREKEMYIERLERDRRWLSDREAEEKAEKEKERLEREEEKVSIISFQPTNRI